MHTVNKFMSRHIVLQRRENDDNNLVDDDDDNAMCAHEILIIESFKYFYSNLHHPYMSGTMT